jgi:hypothetical protein
VRTGLGRSVVRSAVLLGLAVGLGFGVLRFVNAEPAERRVESLMALGIAVPYSAPALLALLGLRGRTALLLGGGVLGVALAVIGPSWVGLALLVPGLVYLVAAVRTAEGWPGPLRAAGVLAVSLVLGVAALFALFLRQDPVCWAVVPGVTAPRSVLLPAERFVRRDSVAMSSQDLPPGAISSGCSSDTIAPVEAAASLTTALLMLASAWALGAPRARGAPLRPERAALLT